MTVIELIRLLQKVENKGKEVKNIYKVLSDISRMQMLSDIFGSRNLTSDKKEPFKVGDTITVPDWTVYSIGPSYIELHKKTCVGITHVATVNKKDILSFGHQPQELHFGDKVDIPGWEIIRKRNRILLLKREMAYGFHYINLEECDLKRETLTLSESDKHAIILKVTITT